jgi:hypothetical protein
MAIDEATYQRYLVAEKAARDRGLALAEVLDQAGLLLTDRRRHNLRVEAVEDVWRRFDRQSPNRLMSFYNQRVDGTSAEMFEAIKVWLEVLARNLANRTLEDL